jgi:2-iminobutanoate/2-iminopropanoate deaminase
MSRQIVYTKEAPEAIGPYSQAVVVHDLIYTAGQIALAPGTSALVGDDVESQTNQVLDNLAAVLKAGGSTFEHVVKVTIYLTDMADFPKVNAIYNERFNEDPPARSTVEVSGLPLGALVEMDMVAQVVDSGEGW